MWTRTWRRIRRPPSWARVRRRLLTTNTGSSKSATAKALELAAKEAAHVAFDFGARDLPTCCGEVFVFFSEDFPDRRARVVPLVNDLIEHARVGVLWRHAEADEFQAHASHFVDHLWNVREPPAAEDVEVAEFSRENAEFMLIFARENRYQEFVFRISGAKIL